MFDSHDDIKTYHRKHVNLPGKEQDEMRDRRATNRSRLCKGLERDRKPKVDSFHKQGSYAMRTMTQQPDKDYDIDDGVYFVEDDLVGPQGGAYSARDARKMVRDAIDAPPDQENKTFKTPPEVKPNCVRVHYAAGYHVDLPVYRWVTVDGEEIAELASADWKRSDARDVTDWFDDENREQSPDYKTGGQLRRITRMLKKFATSRSSWKASVLSTGEWATECMLSDMQYRTAHFPPIVYAWLEPQAMAAHAVVTFGEHGCLRCGFTPCGKPLVPATVWPKELEFRPVAACGGVFTPYGPTELSWGSSLATELTLNVVLGRIGRPTQRTWLGQREALHARGGDWSDEWKQSVKDPGEGGMTVSRKWTVGAKCSLCSS